MLLEKLREYSERVENRAEVEGKERTPVMYQPTVIRWIIHLDRKGGLLDITVTSSENQGKKNDRGKTFLAPTIGKTVNITAKLFAENANYTFGIKRDDPKKTEEQNKQWSIKRHEFYKALIARCAEQTSCPSVVAVRRFYETAGQEDVALPPGFKPGDLFTFSVDGVFPMDEPPVRSFWARETTGGKGGVDAAGGGVTGTCLVCGEKKPAVRILPTQIHGIPGGHPKGAALVSFNKNAFWSFGLRRSYNSPICHECGEDFGKALNNLIETERTHITIGSVVYVFWTRENTGNDAISLFNKPQPEEVKMLLSSPLTGKKAYDLEDVFYCTALSATNGGGRVVVRNWIVTSLSKLKERLATWFKSQSLVAECGSGTRYFSALSLAECLAHTRSHDKHSKSGSGDGNKNQNDTALISRAGETLVSNAFLGHPLPLSLLGSILGRVKAEICVTPKENDQHKYDYGLSYKRAALIKMILVSNNKEKEDTIMLRDDHPEPAYHCGRLFAVLEYLQARASGGRGKLNATITDRYYGRASSMPCLVFGHLQNKAQHHLKKVRSQSVEAANGIDRDITNINDKLDYRYPLTLDLAEQGLFALGYYHQKAENTRRATEYANKKM